MDKHFLRHIQIYFLLARFGGPAHHLSHHAIVTGRQDGLGRPRPHNLLLILTLGVPHILGFVLDRQHLLHDATSLLHPPGVLGDPLLLLLPGVQPGSEPPLPLPLEMSGAALAGPLGEVGVGLGQEALGLLVAVAEGGELRAGPATAGGTARRGLLLGLLGHLPLPPAAQDLASAVLPAAHAGFGQGLDLAGLEAVDGDGLLELDPLLVLLVGLWVHFGMSDGEGERGRPSS